MAGNGLAPAAVRRRRNEPARGDWVDLPPLDKPILPTLRDRLVIDDEGQHFHVPWSDRAKDAWESWSHDPVTQTYTPADIVAVQELLMLFEHMTSDLRIANEVRLRMDGLGLTPKGKRDLRLRVQSSPASALEPVPETKRGRASRTTANRRARLTAVE